MKNILAEMALVRPHKAGLCGLIILLVLPGDARRGLAGLGREWQVEGAGQLIKLTTHL